MRDYERVLEPVSALLILAFGGLVVCRMLTLRPLSLNCRTAWSRRTFGVAQESLQVPESADSAGRTEGESSQLRPVVRCTRTCSNSGSTDHSCQRYTFGFGHVS